MHFSRILVTIAVAAGPATYASPIIFPRAIGKLCSNAEQSVFGICRVRSTGCSGGVFTQLDGWSCSDGSECCVYPMATPSTTIGISDGHINQNGINLIKSAEGLELYIYNDQNGVPTIGYGHNCLIHGCPQNPITEEQADQYLREDLANPANRFETMVCELPGAAGLNDNQFSALVDFAFNVGAWTAEGYLRSVFKGNLAAAIEGVKSNILSWSPIDNRRQRELDLFNVPSAILCGCGGPGLPGIEPSSTKSTIMSPSASESSVTVSSVSELSVTESIITESSTYAPSVTGPKITSSLAIEPPATEFTVTESSATGLPVSEPPTLPVTTPPVMGSPTNQSPATQSSVTATSTTESQTARSSATELPITESKIIVSLVTESSILAPSTLRTPATESPVTVSATTKSVVTRPPVTQSTSIEFPVMESPTITWASATAPPVTESSTTSSPPTKSPIKGAPAEDLPEEMDDDESNEIEVAEDDVEECEIDGEETEDERSNRHPHRWKIQNHKRPEKKKTWWKTRPGVVATMAPVPLYTHSTTANGQYSGHWKAAKWEGKNHSNRQKGSQKGHHSW